MVSEHYPEQKMPLEGFQVICLLEWVESWLQQQPLQKSFYTKHVGDTMQHIC